MLILGQCWSGDNADTSDSDPGTMLEWEQC